MCRGAPLGVAPEYQELVDLGFFGIDEAGVPAPGCKRKYKHVIPWGADPNSIAFRVSSRQQLLLSLLLLLPMLHDSQLWFVVFKLALA